MYILLILQLRKLYFLCVRSVVSSIYYFCVQALRCLLHGQFHMQAHFVASFDHKALFKITPINQTDKYTSVMRHSVLSIVHFCFAVRSECQL